MEIIMNHFSDLHFNSETNLNKMEKLKEKLLLSSPKYIFFTGDILNSNDEQNNKKIDYLLKWLEELAQESKLFIIKGNHDIMIMNENNKKWNYDFDPSLWNEIETINNIHYLSKEKKYIDDYIYISGIDLPFDYYERIPKKEDFELLKKTLKDNQEVLKDLPNDKLKIFMCHAPRFLTEISTLEYLKEFNLVLSGHEHNGMVPRILENRFPGTKGIINASKELFSENVKGVKKIRYSDNLITFIINGGIIKIPLESKFGMFKFLYPMEFTNINYDTDTKKIIIKKIY